MLSILKLKKGFKGGVHPPENKKFTESKPIEEIPLPEKVVIPLQQHLGRPSTAIVEKGAKVKAGDPISEAAGFVSLSWREFFLTIAISASVITVVMTRSRLLAICGLGVIGAGIAMIFLSFGAPDVALTQLLVETLTVIIVSIILLRLPRLSRKPTRTKPKRILDAVLATGAGILVTSLLLALLSNDLDRSLTAFFEQNSYLAAHGRNIVNVILVDFRSMDTLGEIIVVATAGLAGYALILKRRGNK